MKTVPARIALALLLTIPASAADWVTERADAQRSGWQRDEKQLSVKTVAHLRLLWKQKLSEAPMSLSDPSMLGPFITHRGIKELAFVQAANGRVYALDADLGTTFWSRTLQNEERVKGAAICPPVMPAMEPSPLKADYGSDDEFSDGNRALYVLAESGVLYSLRPSTGENYSPPYLLFSPVSVPVSLDALNGVLYAASAAACSDRTSVVGSIPVERSGAQPGVKARRRRLAAYAHSATDLSASARFTWEREDLLAVANEDGSLAIRRTRSLPIVFPASRWTPKHGPALATFETENHNRWIVTAARGNLRGSQVIGSQVIGQQGHPETRTVWDFHLPGADIETGAPVVANGIVYFTAYSREAGQLNLHAVDARTGKPLYTSGERLTSHSSGNIALANGHVCFATDDGTLICFGLSFQM